MMKPWISLVVFGWSIIGVIVFSTICVVIIILMATSPSGGEGAPAFAIFILASGSAVFPFVIFAVNSFKSWLGRTKKEV